jgi:hypothetical protein
MAAHSENTDLEFAGSKRSSDYLPSIGLTGLALPIAALLALMVLR